MLIIIHYNVNYYDLCLCVCECAWVCNWKHIWNNYFSKIIKKQLPITLKGEGFQLISLSNPLISLHSPYFEHSPPSPSPSLPLPLLLFSESEPLHGIPALLRFALGASGRVQVTQTFPVRIYGKKLHKDRNASISSWEKTSGTRPSGKEWSCRVGRGEEPSSATFTDHHIHF